MPKTKIEEENRKNYLITVQRSGGPDEIMGLSNSSHRIDAETEDFKNGFVAGLMALFPETSARRYTIIVEEV